jgi:DNA-binding LacI/PurR family transcriptional regulator
VADITNPYSVAVLRGAEKACQDAGYLVMLFNLGNESEREREAIDALAGYQVDGFILNTLGRGSNVVDAVTLHGKPAVLVDRRHTGMHTDFVSLDNHAAMQATCGHSAGRRLPRTALRHRAAEGRELAARAHGRLRRLRDGARAARGGRGVRIGRG